MATISQCRRRVTRHELPEALAGRIEFGYPQPTGQPCGMPLKDLSNGGLSFVLTRELPGIEVGTKIERVTIRAGERAIRGDLIVIHFTPDETPGSICGALFYPQTDSDTLRFRTLIDELDRMP